MNQRNNIKQLQKEYNQTNEQIQLSKIKNCSKWARQYVQWQSDNYIKEKTMETQRTTEENKSKIAMKVLNEVTGRKGSKCKVNQRESWQDGKTMERTFWNTNWSTCHQHYSITNSSNYWSHFTYKHEQLYNERIKQKQLSKFRLIRHAVLMVWKSGLLLEPLLTICNQILNLDKPDVWSNGGIISFTKKGNLSMATNYRKITLTCISAKLYNKMILNRILAFIDPLLSPNQNGFCKEHSILSQILAIRRKIEGIKEKNLPAMITVIGFCNVSNTTDRSKMFNIHTYMFKAYRISGKIVKAIAIISNNTTATIVSPDSNTDHFEIIFGVLQGDTLAPFLLL